jgi:hypothetical protein
MHLEDHAKEVLNVVLPANHQSTKVMERSESSFHSPASAIATQWTPILSWHSSPSAMGCDHGSANRGLVGHCHKALRRTKANSSKGSRSFDWASLSSHRPRMPSW